MYEQTAHEVDIYKAPDGFLINIEKETIANKNFRKVLYTATKSQLVLMSISPGDDIGEETHSNVDQFIRIEAGKGKVVLNGKEILIEDGSAFVIPARTKHNVINISDEDDLKLYSVYSPPNHPPGTVQTTKAEAEAAEPVHEQEDSGDIHAKIIKFFKANPNPSDKQVHAFADELGMDPHEFEGHIYMVLSSFISKEES